MAMPPTPNIWLEWTSPSGTVYRWAFEPLADQNSFKEQRLLSMGPIARKLSSSDGDSEAPSVEVEIDDADGLIRGILATAATRHAIGGEAAIRILSEAGRKAGTAASDLIRGTVSDLQAPPGRVARLKITGAVSAKFTGIDFNKTFPNLRIGAEHKNAPESSVGLVYPLIIGEHADIDAEDLRGNSVEKGILPAIDVGDYLFLEDGTEVDTDDWPISYLDVPANLDATVNGTPGTRTIVYDVTGLSETGETTAATFTVTTGPEILNGTDSVELTWDADASTKTLGYRVYRNKRRIALLNNGGTWSTPETTYTDEGAEAIAPGPPTSNTATTSTTTDDGEAFPWTRFIAAGKACHVEYVYASDLASSVAPKRARLGASEIETELLMAGEAGWPHANEYVDFTRPDGVVIRQTVFYMRGPRVTHHRNKTVTVAWNGWGVEDVGNLSGDPIIQAFPALQWIANEEWLKDGGAGYTTGTYGPLEEFSNGVSKLASSKFFEAQALTTRFLGDDIGYVINVAITEPTTVRTFLRRFHQTFGSFDATSRLGRFYPVMVDDISIGNDLTNAISPLQDESTMSGNLGDETSEDAPPTGAYQLLGEMRAHRDTVNVIRWVSQRIRYDQTLTKGTFDFSWDADAKRMRMADQVIEYDYLAYGHTAPKQKPKRLCYYTHDQATAYDANDRYIRRHLVPPREMAWAVDLSGLDEELGDLTLLTHYEGTDTDTRVLLIGHETNPMDPQEVMLTALDLTRVVVSTLSPLQNENDMDGNLGDETVDDYPPLGAWELV